MCKLMLISSNEMIPNIHCLMHQNPNEGLFLHFDKPKDDDGPFLLWEDDSSLTKKSNHLAYIPAPKQKLHGHDESYNPPLEYIPTQEEINSYQLMFEEDHPKFVRKSSASIRSIPAYEKMNKLSSADM
ncbi:unnamed protein product [Lathyrus oleraceus]|uniref:Ribosome biogenesis protein 1, variant 3 n=2 Tax=Pisum sativum TaxID=3888 RepID=A0A9D5BB49_PEA|nr:ribosome biogenesis protein BOP1 homolog isoform X1 [Pisum sativum]XP_050905114.1 ribosome biogenesis protein BOP1 homolog isoform X1 [Pisum sativum]XP_050905115.1 ribosome biogenesis protein BOP1 homolog isoform X1 [Pisum sativum]XP_050905119.1 ribosome biogenesis protein BOP1 homolog isoform X1 [Pisum sativum]KAI5436059.1 Ribosome biogenesis protein 1, variant 3 [Pisum sativum]